MESSGAVDVLDLGERLEEQWRINLDQLVELLAGRPTDWRKLAGSEAPPGS